MGETAASENDGASLPNDDPAMERDTVSLRTTPPLSEEGEEAGCGDAFSTLITSEITKNRVPFWHPVKILDIG